MPYPKMEEFVTKLLARTNQGAVVWEQTETEGVYQASFPQYTVRVDQRTTQDETGGVDVDYGLRIFNDRGSIVEEVRDYNLETIPRGKMPELYEAARRKAMGVDRALEDLLEQLGE